MNNSWCDDYEGFENIYPPMYNQTYWHNENDSFYSDYDELYEVPTGIIVLLSFCYGSISVLAVIGNSLVMWIISTSKRMQNVTNYFIANLALADIVIGLFAIPFQFQAALLQRWNLPHFMCPFCPFVQILCVNVSVFTLTAIAIDRHRAILKPLSAKPSKLKAKIIIAGIWLLGGGLAAPIATALRVVMVPESSNVCQDRHGGDRRCERNLPFRLSCLLTVPPLYRSGTFARTDMAGIGGASAISPSVSAAFLLFLHYIGLERTDMAGIGGASAISPSVSAAFLLFLHYIGLERALLGFMQYLTPLSIISCVYARMAVRLWGNTAPGNAENSRDANLMRNKMKVIKMLVIVVALFGICWLPLQTYNVLQYTYPQINEYRYINIIWFSFDWLAMSNSCYNPFIYGIYNENFKREFQQRCPFKSCKRSNPSTGSVDSNKLQNTRTSVRFNWKRSTPNSYPAFASFYRGVAVGESSHSKESTESRQKKNVTSYFVRNDSNDRYTVAQSVNKSEELYVFSSKKRNNTQTFTIDELCL